MSPTLAGEFFTTEPSGKPDLLNNHYVLGSSYMSFNLIFTLIYKVGIILQKKELMLRVVNLSKFYS